MDLKLFVFLSLAIVACTAAPSKAVPKCTITKQVATQIRNEFAEELSVKNEPVPNNCDALVDKITDYALRLKNSLKQSKPLQTEIDEKMQKFHQIEDVKNFNTTVHAVKGYFKTHYTKTFYDLNKNLRDIEKSIKESLATQLPSQIKLDLYSFINNHNELDLDENPRDTANTCEISGAKAQKLFEVFNEIRDLSHIQKSEVCKDLIREMINIRGITARTKKYEKNMLISIDMRLSEQQRLIKKFTNHIKENRKDYDSLGDDLAVYKAYQVEVLRGENSLKGFKAAKAYETIGKSIQNAKNINILNDAIPDCADPKSNVDPLSKALSEAYKCDKTKLTQIYKFLEKYNDQSKFNWLLAEMKKCKHDDELILLKVLKSSTTREDFKGKVDQIHKKFAERMKKNDTNIAKDIIEYKDFLDPHKIVEQSFDRNMKNFDITRKFIENSDHRLFLEKDLTRESEFADGAELPNKLKLGFWLRSRHDQFKQDKEFMAKMNELRESKLPHVVNVLCFNSFSLISSDSSKPLIRPGTASPTTEFQNLVTSYFETDQGVYLSLHDSRHPDESLCISNDGNVNFVDNKKNSNKCLWEVKLTTGRTDCNNCVTITDQSNGKFLSSEYTTSCAEKNWIRKCVRNQSFNQAVLPSKKYPNAEVWKIN